MPGQWILDVEDRTHGHADLLAVIEADALRVVYEHSQNTVLAAQFDLEIRQFVSQLDYGRLEELNYFIPCQAFLPNHMFQNQKMGQGPILNLRGFAALRQQKTPERGYSSTKTLVAVCVRTVALPDRSIPAAPPRRRAIIRQSCRSAQRRYVPVNTRLSAGFRRPRQAARLQAMYDVAIIGGGVVGLSTAWQLKQRRPDLDILVLEKEPTLAQHQSGHNSGVIHAGIYYEPGSLKAEFCRKGVEATVRFCQANNLPYEQCGKLIVATDAAEQERLITLFERARENGIDVQLLDAEELRDLEPNVRGVGAIYSPSTGIVDYGRVTNKMAERFRELGGEVRTGSRVAALNELADRIDVTLSSGVTVQTHYLLVCGGLMADRLVRLIGIEPDFAIVPYRGEYYQLPPDKNDLVRHLIYPVPDPDLPFLGVHLTRMIDGSITVGPNAVQGFKREGYGRLNVSARDTWEMMRFEGFRRLTRRYLRTGLVEMWNSMWKRGYLQNVRKYCPSIKLSDLGPYPAGIRAQAVSRNGALVHDFLFVQTSRSLHVCNAPSPAATSAIPIGDYLCDQLLDKMHDD